jgi:hypothetical protein
MKRTMAYILMGIYSSMLIIGLIYNSDSILALSTALAIFTGLWIQQHEKGKSPDEREHFIVQRASAASYLALMTVILLGYIGADAFDILAFLSVSSIFQVLIGFAFYELCIHVCSLFREVLKQP